MNFFFDNNLSPALAKTIDAYLSYTEQRAIHIRDINEFGMTVVSNSKDTEWIEALGKDNRNWIVFTQDRNIRKVKIEKLAFQKARLKGFLLSQSFQKLPMNKQASILLWRWPELIDLMSKFNPPVLIEVPASKSAKLTIHQW